MKRIMFATLALCAVGLSSLALAEDSPRVKCLTKCKETLQDCLKKAGKDETKKSACNKAVADCVKVCPAPSP